MLIWDLKSGSPIHRLSGRLPKNQVVCTAISFSVDDRRALAALIGGTVLVWDLTTEQEQHPITLNAGPITREEFPRATFTADRQHLVTARRTGVLELWELQTGTRLQRFVGHGGAVYDVASSQDGRLILSAGADSTIRLWNVATGKELKSLRSDDRSVSCVTFAPDGRRVMSAGIYGTVHLWDLASGKEMCRMEGHTMAVNSIAFSPDGRRAVSGSDDRTVRLWQLPESGVAGGAPPNAVATPTLGQPDDTGHLPAGAVKSSAATLAGTTPAILATNDAAQRIKSSFTGVPEEPPKHITNTIRMKLVLISTGKFVMGSPDSDPTAKSDEQPQHPVRISKPFYLGIHEVTQGQYRAVMGDNPSRFKGSDDLPVERVSWLDAVEFCNKLSVREHRTVFYRIDGTYVTLVAGNGYRLPTEAEWEYACRAGSSTRFPFGHDASMLGQYAWHPHNGDNETHPVGQKLPNAWGLHDMLGNVWEWCGDWYGETYYASSPGSDPPGPASPSGRVLRGGCWGFVQGDDRSAKRFKRPPSHRDATVGFRLALASTGP